MATNITSPVTEQLFPSSNDGEAERKILGIPAWAVLVGLFFVGWIFMYADRMILNPVMGLLQKDYDLSLVQLGLVNSVFLFVYTLLQVPAGVLGDKLGRKIMLVPGVILFGLATAFTGMINGFYSLLFARGAVGAGQSTYFGPQYAILNEVVPAKRRGLCNAITNSGMSFGIALGLMGSSYLVHKLGMSWRMPFFIYAIPTVIIGVLIWFLVKEKSRKAVQAESNGQPAVTIGSLLRNRNLLLTWFMVFCSLFGFFVMLTWLPYYLQNERNVAATEAGYLSSLLAWVAIPGALIISSFSDKLQKRKAFTFVMVPIAALSLLATGYAESQVAIGVALVVYGFFGKLAMDPILYAVVAESVPKESYSTAFGVNNFIGMSGSILAPTVAAFLAKFTGTLASSFYFAAALLMCGLIGMCFVKEKPKLV